jgi:pimeloyl-ACP methyl ester carboxylesterase
MVVTASSGRSSPTVGAYRSGANVLLATLGSDIEYQAVDLVAEDRGTSRGLLYRRHGTMPRVGVHLMHPRTDQSRNYLIAPLVERGFMVLGRAGRWVNNDIATEHERLLPDMAAGVQLLIERGCERVVLLGNSGGGSLAAFYQAQAARRRGQRLTQTAAGTPFDLNAYDLPAADGVALVGAHPGEGACLMKWLDPSLTDEEDWTSLDPSLDMYDPVNGFVVPPSQSRYSDEFLTRFRAAQRRRVQRLDARARTMLRTVADAACDTRRSVQERERWSSRVHHMVIHRTMADPAFCDLSIDPDDRTVAAYNNHPRPDLVNCGAGVASVLQPQAWLSTWSGLSSRAETVDNLTEVQVPTLVVHYAGDSITRLSEASAMAAAPASNDTSFEVVGHADHYGFRIAPDGTRGERTTEGSDALVEWVAERFGG